MTLKLNFAAINLIDSVAQISSVADGVQINGGLTAVAGNSKGTVIKLAFVDLDDTFVSER